LIGTVEEVVRAVKESLATGGIEKAVKLFASLDPPSAFEVLLR